MLKPVDPFIGRKPELDELKIAESGNKAIVITGKIGIGKTELARKYAKFFKDDDTKSSLIWIDSESVESVIFAFQDLATYIGIRIAEKVPSDIIKETFAYFADKRTLFIFDNARNDIYVLNNLQKFMPSTSNNYVVVTSRDKKWNTNKFKVLELSTFTQEESLEFLTKNLPPKHQNPKDLAKLANTLKNIPLALRKAVDYLNEEEDSYTINDFIEDFAQSVQDLSFVEEIESKIEAELEEELTHPKQKEESRDIFEELGVKGSRVVYATSVRPPTGQEIRHFLGDKIEKEVSRFGQRVSAEAKRSGVKVSKFFKRLKSDVFG